MVVKANDNEDLELFLEMRRLEREKEFRSSFEAPTGTERESLAVSKIVSVSQSFRKTAADRFLDSENDKSDFDWLITPPRTPVPASEMESRTMATVQPTAFQSRLTNSQDEPTVKSNAALKQTTMSSLLSSSANIRRSSSSGGLKSATRSATPTGRPTLQMGTKSSSRPSTPTSRSAKAADPQRRSLTPNRTTAKCSKPTAMFSVPATKPLRSATPTHQSSNPSNAPVTAPRRQSSSVTKSVPTVSRKPVPSRGSSPTVRSRTWKPNEMPGFSNGAPPNLKTSVPDRPSSASRGRPRVASDLSSSSEGGPSARPRNQSCSPAKVRASNGSLHGSRIVAFAKSRAHSSNNDDVNPVLMGTKIVERVVNMRKLAPPKQDDRSNQMNSAGKTSSVDSTGFGRTLSKTSLDMAMRHMDIKRSIPGNIRPLKSIISTSSTHSVRSGGSLTSSEVGFSDSPLATSSIASSETSVNNSFSGDRTEMEDNDY